MLEPKLSKERNLEGERLSRFFRWNFKPTLGFKPCNRGYG
jgi:hypothetical protein